MIVRGLAHRIANEVSPLGQHTLDRIGNTPLLRLPRVVAFRAGCGPVSNQPTADDAPGPSPTPKAVNVGDLSTIDSLVDIAQDLFHQHSARNFEIPDREP